MSSCVGAILCSLWNKTADLMSRLGSLDDDGVSDDHR